MLFHKAAEPARWLIVAGIAWTLASTGWFFISGPEQASRPPAATAPGPTSKARRPTPVSVNTIVSRNLFGKHNANTVVQQDTAPAVETRLPLELRGVFVAEIAEHSVAIVAQRGKSGNLYAVGDTLPGNAELIEVHDGHIVLRRAGSRETLTFPLPETQLIGAHTPLADDPAGMDDWPEDEESLDDDEWSDEAFEDEAPFSETRADHQTAPANVTSARDLVDQYRERIEQDPDGMLQELGIQAVSQDAASGYRLGALAQSPYLSQTGLQPGDVVLSVNGQAVGNVRQDQQQIDNILAQGSARLEVQRGTRRFFVTASLK